jgi:hypothetical protein
MVGWLDGFGSDDSRGGPGSVTVARIIFAAGRRRNLRRARKSVSAGSRKQEGGRRKEEGGSTKTEAGGREVPSTFLLLLSCFPLLGAQGFDRVDTSGAGCRNRRGDRSGGENDGR